MLKFLHNVLKSVSRQKGYQLYCMCFRLALKDYTSFMWCAYKISIVLESLLLQLSYIRAAMCTLTAQHTCLYMLAMALEVRVYV